MILNNFYKLMQLCVVYGGDGFLNPVPVKLMNTNGASVVFKTSVSDSSVYKEDVMYALAFYPKGGVRKDYHHGENGDNSRFIVLGSGSGAVTPDDYKLENILTKGFDATVVTKSGTDESGNCYSQATITVTATTDEGITIGEIGFVASHYYSSGEPSFLFDRTVLDTPVRLAKAQTASIQYRITNASAFNV